MALLTVGLTCEPLHRLKGLSHVLQDVEDVFSAETLTKQQDENLCDILTGCHDLLTEVGIFVSKHSAVEHKQGNISGKLRRVWHRLRWDTDTVDSFRARITSQVGLLNAFMSSITR